jgi:hypothetical protein
MTEEQADGRVAATLVASAEPPASVPEVEPPAECKAAHKAGLQAWIIVEERRMYDVRVWI